MKLLASEDRPIQPPGTEPHGLLAQIWIGLKELWCESIPLWFPLMSVALALIAGLTLDQTIGILQALVDQSERSYDATNIALAEAQRWHCWAFIGSLCLWSFVNYQATRLLHQFDYNSPEYTGRLSDRKGWLGWTFKQLEWLSPILAGLGPAAVLALGFHVLDQRYSAAEHGLTLQRKLTLYVPCILIAALVVWRPFRVSRRAAGSHSRQLNDVLSRNGIRLVWLLLAAIVLLVLGAAYAPEKWSLIGPAATLCLGATVFVVLGSLLVFWGGRWRIPLLSITVLYCTMISPWNDNHSVRVARGAISEKMPERLGIRDQIAAFKELSAPERKKRPGQKTPLFIICAEGGGVRAAYWAARLLAYLEDTTRHYPEQYVPFSSRVLAISGVSGGSLGAATFTALLDGYAADTANRGDWFFNRTANFLGRDQLSAPLASAAFIDTTQRFIPYPIFDQRDRAAGLERAWENAWGESLKYADGNISRFCRFDDDFRKLWRHRDTAAAARGEGSSTQWIPSLFFNSTAVELGGRIIASDCQIPAGDYPGAQDAFSLLRLRDSEVAKSERDLFRLSSAVNLSTRFPGISPSGELPAGNSQFPQRVVDGGYYDNSGARTAWDNLVVVYYDLLNSVHSPAEASDVIPWVIVIRAGPRTKRQAPSVTSEVPSGWNFLPPQARPVPRHFMVDVLAPARAFLNAWGARSADSIEALRDGTFLISRRLAAQEGQDGQRGTPSPDSTDGSLPLERVDYSVASHRALTDPLRSDPFVIDLNLELDAPDSSSTDSQHRQKLLLPLGWMLPAKAREVMESEIHDRLAPAPALLEATTWDEDWFRRLQQSQLGRVLSLLHRERPTKPVPGEAQGSSRP